MAGAFWCVVEDDRKGTPKKVMAEVIGEAARLGGPVEAVWLTDKATDDGLKQLGALGRDEGVAARERRARAVPRRSLGAAAGRAGRQGVAEGDPGAGDEPAARVHGAPGRAARRRTLGRLGRAGDGAATRSWRRGRSTPASCSRRSRGRRRRGWRRCGRTCSSRPRRRPGKTPASSGVVARRSRRAQMKFVERREEVVDRACRS